MNLCPVFGFIFIYSPVGDFSSSPLPLRRTLCYSVWRVYLNEILNCCCFFCGFWIWLIIPLFHTVQLINQTSHLMTNLPRVSCLFCVCLSLSHPPVLCCLSQVFAAIGSRLRMARGLGRCVSLSSTRRQWAMARNSSRHLPCIRVRWQRWDEWNIEGARTWKGFKGGKEEFHKNVENFHKNVKTMWSVLVGLKISL